MEQQTKEDVKKHLSNLFKARFPIIYIPTWEENRIIETLSYIAETENLIKTKRILYIWSQTQGFYNYDSGKVIQDTKSPIKALDYIIKSQEPAIFTLKDFHVYFGGNKFEKKR